MRTPRTHADLTRPELAARISTLRSVLDQMWGLTAMQGAEPFACLGAVKKDLIHLEADLRQRDRDAAFLTSLNAEPLRASA